MFLVAFKSNGKDGGISVGIKTSITHYIYYISHKVAIEQRVLLLARTKHKVFYLWDIEYRTPCGLIAILPLIGNIPLYAQYIFHYLSLELLALRLLDCLVRNGSRLWLVAIVIVDDGGGIGIVVLHSAYMYLLKRVARTRVTFDIDVNIAFFFRL